MRPECGYGHGVATAEDTPEFPTQWSCIWLNHLSSLLRRPKTLGNRTHGYYHSSTGKRAHVKHQDLIRTNVTPEEKFQTYLSGNNQGTTAYSVDQTWSNDERKQICAPNPPQPIKFYLLGNEF